MTLVSRRSVLALCLSILAPAAAIAAQPATYFPPQGDWARKSPAELGLDPAALSAAVQFAQSRETTRAVDFSDQEATFGSRLGSMPTQRARTNGLVIYKGYVVAEFGDTAFVDPTYSVAKSILATVAGVAVRDGRFAVDEPVGRRVTDGGYASPQNAAITWQQHLQQESEWEGSMWGKNADFIGKAAFGAGQRKPRALQKPGSFYEYNDVRINRFALSLTHVFGQSVPEVFQQQVMNPIGASNSWKWVPYHNSYVELNGKQLPSVSGGTRWGGGMWINSWDMARFGYLWLQGGAWNGKQLLPPSYVKAALSPSANGPDYGYLWWLNTKGKNLPGLPSNAYAALGAGNNTIVVSPDHDLVIVWRWHAGNAAEFATKVIASIRR
ncbi:serine hydrolase domain-containing protein [Massilia yuzhufengensis]|uniref:CubicO group peptidase, beta-lactamase class C family n=1 Tax=Massilia yuzhufengensis TaxID=1164594 RepID=A0A1I1NNJ8_9BURK|nr:serine hydrolase [Massilia yuzhufengensis]SFC95320.1 CubicO group peptidase, beta-lactamase class C family [Massilia yuzhufengensis]